MHTETTPNEIARFVIDAIRYLVSNDFRSITQTGLRVIRAKDGKQPVLIWLDSGTMRKGAAKIAVPTKLIKMAFDEGCRIDIIRIEHRDDGTSQMKHLMNVDVQ